MALHTSSVGGLHSAWGFAAIAMKDEILIRRSLDPILSA